MRVCYISTHALSTDGWGRYTVELASGVRAHGVEPVLVTADPAVDPSLADVEHHPILPMPFAGRFAQPRAVMRAPALRRILATCDAAHCTVELYAPVVAAAVEKKPFVLSVYGTWAIRPLEGASMRRVFRWAFGRANLVLSISRYTQERLAPLVTLRRIEVLPGGVHPERFAEPVEADLPAWVGREPFALSVGAVKPRKGQHVALEAVALARKQVPNLHYVVVGTLEAAPTYVARLREWASELGVGDAVHFLGRLPAPYGALVAWYQKADVFILPSVSQGSSFEGLGLVYLEAGAAGTPSIGTHNCGAEEAIVDGETGLLVPQNDPQATAEALVRLLTDNALRTRMGQAARLRAHTLSWARLAERTVGYYREIVA